MSEIDNKIAVLEAQLNELKAQKAHREDHRNTHRYIPAKLTIGLEEKVQAALEIAWRYGATDGADHKMWVINQMIDTLTHGGLWEFRENYEKPLPNGDFYAWDEGVAP